MCQEKVFNFFKKHENDWFSGKQVAKALNQGVGSTQSNLRKLAKGRFLEKQVVPPRVYIYKIRKEVL